MPELNSEMTAGDTIRMVGLRKKPGQPLGLTVIIYVYVRLCVLY